MKQFIIIICHMLLIIGEALTKNFENKLCRNSPVTSWANARVKLHDLTFPDLTCPDLTSPYLTCPDLTCPDLTCPDLIQRLYNSFKRWILMALKCVKYLVIYLDKKEYSY